MVQVNPADLNIFTAGYITGPFIKALTDQVTVRAYQNTVIPLLTAEGLEFGAQIIAKEMVDMAATGLGEAANVGLEAANTSVSKTIRDRRYQWQIDNYKVGLAANAAAANALASRTIGGGGDYRSGESGKLKRYAGGVLHKALLDPAMFVATPDGISWGNWGHLWIHAKQWYRLNFGVAPASPSFSPQNYTMIFYDRPAGDINLFQYGQRLTPMKLPPGWFGGEGNPTEPGAGRGQEFTPSSANPKAKSYRVPTSNADAIHRVLMRHAKITKGIKAINYLDEGLRVLTERLPKVWENNMRRVMQFTVDSGGTAGAPAVKGVDLADTKRGLTDLNVKHKTNMRNIRVSNILRP